MKQSYVVVTPVRNEERTSELTMRSMLAQTIPPLSWVIVDDGSTDRTRQLIGHHSQARRRSKSRRAATAASARSAEA